MKKALPLLALLLVSLAFAQDATPGIPAEYQPYVTAAVALLTGILVQPLTAVFKKLWNTSGPSTVGLSAVLSLLIGVGFTAWAAVTAQGDVPWAQAIMAAVFGFFKANGDYITRVFGNLKALEQAAPLPTAPITPPEGGLEQIP
ncbi:hypothetical protein [Deinococcus marmoris]|uniref:hypothetical protein n=1 Tax=Deinococcus marmoris TaxID=249408 RepID=UPI00054F5091|nr:hypothetical protein [Deinococcus marmoris]